MGVLCHNPLQAPRYQSDLMLQKVRLLSWYVATTSSLNGRDMGSWMGGRTGLMPSSHGHRAGLTVSLLESPLNNHKKKKSDKWKLEDLASFAILKCWSSVRH